MANTLVPSTPTAINVSATHATVYLTLVSDGTNETATVIYDSSAVATQAGDTDPLTCTIESIYCSASVASTARIRFLFDASTDTVAFDVPPISNPIQVDFRRSIPIGGLKNSSGTGRTGDILLTTTGLASGDTITLVMEVRRT